MDTPSPHEGGSHIPLQASPLTPGKFRPPRHRVAALARGRLLDQLDAVLGSTVTIVRTPAGFDKTILLRQWHDAVGERGTRTAWLSLDRHDRDPSTFVAGFAHAVAECTADGDSLRRATHQAEIGVAPEQVIKSVLVGLEQDPTPIVIFLDDYHLVESEPLDLLVGDLLRGLPSHAHLVLATRTKPALKLSALRAAGRIHALTAQAMRFDDEEVARFLGEAFDQRDVSLLARVTEGWPVALQIARLWINEQSDARSLIADFSGTTEDMAAYMVDQVMEHLPEATRDMLVRTSILGSVNGDIANHLCQRDDCWRMLEELERLSPLIFPVDAARTTYRHHHLFAEFLQNRLKRYGDAERRLMHRRAAAWLAVAGQVFEAVEHARAADDADLALTLLDRAGLFHLMLREGADRYRRFKVLFTPEALDRYPRIAVAQALLWIKEGQLQEAQALLGSLRGKLHAGHYDDGDSRRDQLNHDIQVMEGFLGNYLDAGVTAEAATAMERFVGTLDPAAHWHRALVLNLLCTMHLHRGDLPRASRHGAASIDQFSLARLDYGLFFMSLHHGGLRLLQGDLTSADDDARRAKSIVQDCFPDDANIRAHWRIFDAELHYERNELGQAGQHILDALVQVEQADGWVEAHLTAYRVALGVAHARDGLAGIEPILAMGRRFARQRGLQRLEWFLSAREAHYRTLAGDLDAARIILSTCARDLEVLRMFFDEAQIWREREEHQAATARLLIAEGRADEARALLEPLAAIYAAKGHGWRLIQTLLQLALAQQARGDDDAAARHLGDALRLSREERTLRLFVEEGVGVLSLLESALLQVGNTQFPETVGAWMAEIRDSFENGGSGAIPEVEGALLTRRENDVLLRLREGKSNKLIGRELNITDNAVKYHLKNIYRKLGVNDRRKVSAAAGRQAGRT
jgi:LuxR family maltose regulon positive regulatory protein